MAGGYDDFLFDYRQKPTQPFNAQKYLPVGKTSYMGTDGRGREGGTNARTNRDLAFTAPTLAQFQQGQWTQTPPTAQQTMDTANNAGLKPWAVPQFSSPADYFDAYRKSIQGRYSGPSKAWATNQYGPNAPWALRYNGRTGLPWQTFKRNW